MAENKESQFHKGCKNKSYNLQFKLDATRCPKRLVIIQLLGNVVWRLKEEENSVGWSRT